MKTKEEARREAYEREREITNTLLRNLRGRWGEVLSALIPGLQAAVDAGHRKKVQCPISDHGGGKRASGASDTAPNASAPRRRVEPDFRIAKDFDATGGCHCTCNNEMGNGFRVLMARFGCSFMEAKQMVIDHLGGRTTTNHLPPPTPIKAPNKEEIAQQDALIRKRLERTWNTTLSPSDARSEPMRNWFEARGLGSPEGLNNLRFHPALSYVDYDTGEYLGKFPAQVALLQHIDGTPVTLHRTYLSPDGRRKADVPMARKAESHTSDRDPCGAAVHLDRHTHRVLAVGEGLESSVAARRLVEDLGIPMWSTLDANGMRNLILPDWAEIVVVFGDRDRAMAGQASSFQLVEAARRSGRRATALLPPFAIPEGEKSIDWDDVVMTMGVEAARAIMQLQQWRSRLKQVLRESGRMRSPKEVRA
ncbi:MULTISPECIES: DUF7146 domain-containing protein [unclassified Rhodanobacter]|uniref:DUF7146 domain-containing protein n=1 Tax=unclassified Rhodanobacter TaxID=2621553 RepID=UPI000A80F560|nr:toprim domain-containing protein [Rhodanobacter sp. FW510-R10]